ncbi:hypothetical protein T4E_11438 [Trichinella pseudospiralis]|uniref:Uncharacterized protein n=1 Tax=Trichinella pseudospiralis TaxID=6337 RepID=A0A0V0W870_TRIPS|nr:hypothetical protein T4E_11438 [Trichinella pseudospiralis]
MARTEEIVEVQTRTIRIVVIVIRVLMKGRRTKDGTESHFLLMTTFELSLFVNADNERRLL